MGGTRREVVQLWRQPDQATVKDLALIVIGLLGFVFGAYQWWFNRRWKQWEFVAKQISELEANLLFRAAMRMLDFRKGSIVINGETICFDREWLAASITPHRIADWPDWTEQQVAVRLAFSEFLDGLERLCNYVNAGLLTYKHLDPYVPYWIERLTYVAPDSTREPHADGFRGCLWSFIDSYGSRVPENSLSTTLRAAPWTKRTQGRARQR